MTLNKLAATIGLSTLALSSMSALADTPRYISGGGTGPNNGGTGHVVINYLGELDEYSPRQINDHSPYRSHTVCLERGRTYRVWLGSYDFNPYPYILPDFT